MIIKLTPPLIGQNNPFKGNLGFAGKPIIAQNSEKEIKGIYQPRISNIAIRQDKEEERKNLLAYEIMKTEEMTTPIDQQDPYMRVAKNIASGIPVNKQDERALKEDDPDLYQKAILARLENETLKTKVENSDDKREAANHMEKRKREEKEIVKKGDLEYARLLEVGRERIYNEYFLGKPTIIELNPEPIIDQDDRDGISDRVNKGIGRAKSVGKYFDKDGNLAIKTLDNAAKKIVDSALKKVTKAAEKMTSSVKIDIRG